MVLMRQAMGLLPDEFRTDDRLKEISFGTWEGLTWPEIAAADALRHAERKRDRWAFVPPAGESYAQVAGRLEPWLEEIAGRCRGGGPWRCRPRLAGHAGRPRSKNRATRRHLARTIAGVRCGERNLDLTSIGTAARRLPASRLTASHAAFT